MAEKSGIEHIVERVVTQVLESHVSSLRDDLVNQVLAQLQAELANSPVDVGADQPPQNYSAELLKAVSSIHAGTTQKEILAALLDNSAQYRGRAALFVIKSGTATGWQGRNFGKDEINDFSLDVNNGLVGQVISSKVQAAGAASDMDPHFVSKFGASADNQVFLLPLLLKDKLAAIVYADAGTEVHGKVDANAMGLLVTATSAWLEVASLRKQTQREGTDTVVRQDSGPAMQAVSSAPDPFAAHAPIHAAAMPAPAVEHSVPAEAPPSAMAAAASASSSTVGRSPQDEEIHRKAQRFARLLMDEINLYNQAKVNEGRKHKDLYDRLKEDIEKSRATYKKRYGNTPAASGDYFNHELLRSLAEDDVALMGANFRPS